jgi:hypothetical protein
MIEVTEQTKRAYTSGSVQKTLTISVGSATLRNDDIVSESLVLKEAIEESGYLTYKGCIASELRFDCADVVQDFRGQSVTVTIQAGETETITLFTGKVVEQTNLSHADKVTSITCYDAMYDILQTDVTDWYNALTFPITVKNFRDSLFTQLGVTQETVSLINDTRTLSKTIQEKTVNAGDLVKNICQLNARYGQIGRDGKFYYKKLTMITEGLYPAVDLYPSPNLFPSAENAGAFFNKANYIKVTYEPFKTEAVNKVNVYAIDGSVGGTYGGGTNELSISDNPLAYGVDNMTLAATNIYGEVYNIRFIPAGVDVPGMPWMECGDSVAVNTRKNIVRTYILSRTFSGIQALFDSYTADSSQYMPVYKQSLKTGVDNNTKVGKENTQAITVLRADVVEADRIITNNLNAVSARVGSLEADHVTVTQLNAVSARVGTLEADHVSVSQLNALSASVSTLAAQDAQFQTATANALAAQTASINNLRAIAITTQNLSAQSISASQLTTGSIDGNRVEINNARLKGQFTSITGDFVWNNNNIGFANIGGYTVLIVDNS